MKKLRWNLRNAGFSTNGKVAVVSINIFKDIFVEVKNEGILCSSFVFAYEGGLYNITYCFEDGIDKYSISAANDSNIPFYSSFDELLTHINFTHEVVVLYEFQSLSMIDTPDEIMPLVEDLVDEETNLVTLPVYDNYLLNNYLFDYETLINNNNLNSEMINLLKMNVENTKESKKVIIKILVISFLFIAGIITLVAIFGE